MPRKNDPLVIWHPLLDVDPLHPADALDDYKRALHFWDGQTLVWSHPTIQQARSFTMRTNGLDTACLAVPGAAWNLFTIWHVTEVTDKDGKSVRAIYPRIPFSKGSTVPEGLYLRWLESNPGLEPLPRTMRFVHPVFENERAVLVRTELKLSPAGRYNDDLTKDGPGLSSVVSQGQPPRVDFDPGRAGGKLIPKEDYPKFARDWPQSLAQLEDGTYSIASRLSWPEPFSNLLSLNGGLRPMWYREQIREAIELAAENNYDAALRIVQTSLSDLSGETLTTYFQPRIAPHLLIAGEDQLWNYVSPKYRGQVSSLEEFERMPEGKEVLNRRVQARVLLGWEAYFLDEFSRDLRRMINVRFCDNCGMPIRGGQGNRRFCGNNFEPDEQARKCKRERDRLRQAEARRKRGTPSPSI